MGDEMIWHQRELRTVQLDRAVQNRIGRGLWAIYSRLVADPPPVKHQELLLELHQKEQKRSGPSGKSL